MMLSDQQRKKAFNTIILTQCLGMLTVAFFQNGFYLNYFTRLGISSALIAFFFALPPLISAGLMLPFAYLADRHGKLKLALMGQVLTVISMVVLMAAGWGHETMIIPLIIAAMVLFALGSSIQGANWFALLSPIVPKEIRGRFFGRLRMTFTITTILFSILITRVLDHSDAMLSFQVLLGLVLVAHIARYFTYARIPELEQEHHLDGGKPPLRESLRTVFRVEGFPAFNAYAFLITLFTAGVPVTFGLMQKDVFGFSPALITLMGTLFLAGGVAGYIVGGKMVDYFGTRIVFLACHISFALIILSMLVRFWVPWPITVHMGICVFMYNLVEGAKGIAVTSEMMALTPPRNKSLSTAVCVMLFSLGVGGSQFFVSASTGTGLLATEWMLLGRTYSNYDALLILFMIMVLLMLATIGLVPKVVKNVQLLPGSGYPRI